MILVGLQGEWSMGKLFCNEECIYFCCGYEALSAEASRKRLSLPVCVFSKLKRGKGSFVWVGLLKYRQENYFLLW